MKILKWLLYVVLFLAALILLVPLFLPSHLSTGTTITVASSPAAVFQVAATYTDRHKWDPWLAMDSTAGCEIKSEPDYVGSNYTWKGDKIGSGKMLVDSVDYARHIWASIWFGPDPRPSQVEWILEPVGDSTLIHWMFHTKAGYPIGRIMMTLMKNSLQDNFKQGMANFKAYIEANPPELSSLSLIERAELPAMNAMVIQASATMDEMEGMMGSMYNELIPVIQAQGLQISGMPFSHYLSYDQQTGQTEFLVGFQVATPGKSEGNVIAKSYPVMKVVQGIHTGPYDLLYISYGAFHEFFMVNNITPAGQAFEFYINNPEEVKNPTRLETLIAFPL